MTRTKVFRHGEEVIDQSHPTDGDGITTMVRCGHISTHDVFTVNEGGFLDVKVKGYETTHTDNGDSYTLKLNNNVVESGLLYDNVPNPITFNHGGIKWGMHPGQDIEIHIVNNPENE